MTGDNCQKTANSELRTQKKSGSPSKSRGSKMMPGYSLTELLVVMLLFSFAMLILGQTYIQFIRLSNKTANAAAVQQDSRFVLEYLARAIRNNQVDYSVSITSPTSSLRLLKENGDYIHIYKSTPGDPLCADEAGVSCILVTTDSGTTFAPLTAKNINVDDFRVYVQPTSSPFELTGFPADYPSDNQPFVGVNFTFTYKANNPREAFTQTAQTGISSRVYVR